jgi:membrane protein DedA with SNARE-associated domain
MDMVFHWVAQYGYAALFGCMMFGIVGLPIPDETLLMFAGYLVSRNSLQLQYVILSGFLGSIAGISLSYEIGRRYGLTVLLKFHTPFFSEEKLKVVRDWYQRIGKWLLIVGYFIPGIRHLTAFTAGMSGLRYRSFGMFAYSGALIWALTFVFLGKLVGEQWQTVSDKIQSNLLLASGIGIVVLIMIEVLRRVYRSRRNPPQS